ncbi:MAG: lysophospholipid acyltransferase family protein [Bacteroidales bacterium]|nr:lysophospholipid acyltransferase family protein [Bacteroidales bacterium]
MNLLLAFIFSIFVFLLGLFPFFLLYQLSNLLYLFIYLIFGYRKKVIIQNLKKCFPEKNDKEIKKLLPAIYKNLTDNIVEGIKAFTMARKQIIKRHKIINPELLKNYYESGQSIIAVTGHYCNWEWGSLSASLQTDYTIVGLYKPLSNKWIDSFMRWSRARCGTKMVSINETTSTFKALKNTPTAFLMAADQSPGPKYKDNAYWINFLGIDTPFLHGPEKHARANNYTVMYIDVQRKKRGYYTIELSVLADKPSELEDGEITSRFANKLESVIYKEPANWLWSHRRWKLSR